MRGITVLACAIAAALVACEKPHDHGEHEHLDTGHDHAPKYGGRLVELGEHEFQVELVHHADTGMLDAYIWDGHVEVPVPCAMTALQVRASVGDKDVTVVLGQAKNLYAEETDGKASKFSGQHDALKGAKDFDGELVEVTVADKSFSNVAFHYHAEGEVHDHEHDHEH
ncbi:MAG: hypothetical protein ACYTGZ_15925 [Planctomycetota bacterium]|jgi:hypothetical protein